jgi:hypothetical protein
MLRLDQKGSAHWFIPLIAIVSVAFIGAKLLHASHAQTAQSVPSITNVGTPTSGVPVPSAGAYFGGSASGSDGVSFSYGSANCNGKKSEAELECKVGLSGKQQGLISTATYVGTSEHFFDKCDKGNGVYSGSGPVATSAAKAGRKMLFINMKCGGNWLDLANAPATASIVSQIKAKVDAIGQLKNSSGKPLPVVLTFNHEPENDSCDITKKGVKTTGKGTPEDFRAASRRFSQIVRAEAAAKGYNNISIGWILMGMTYDNYPHKLAIVFPAGGGCTQNGQWLTASSPMMRDPENWYPGDDAVDWINADPYDQNSKRSFTDIVGTAAAPNFYQWAKGACPPTSEQPTTNYNCSTTRQSKPLALTEFGTAGTSTYKKNWYVNAAAHVADYPGIKAYAYWSSQVDNDHPDYNVDHPAGDPNHQSLAGFARFALSSAFTTGLRVGGSGDNPPTVSIPTSYGGTLVGTNVALQATAADDHGVRSVTFSYKQSAATAWTAISSDPTAPYQASWNTSGLTSGTYDIRALATDTAGQTNAATTPITLISSLPPSGQPDLVVTALTSAPLTPTASQGVIFKARVKNQGTNPVPAGTIVGVAFSVDGVKQTWSGTYDQGLAPGASALLTANNGITGKATWHAVSGTHTVRALVNDLGRITESSSSNDSRSMTLVVGGKIACSDGGFHVWRLSWNHGRPTTCRA